MKTCDFCRVQNQYICDPEDHCGMCPKWRVKSEEDKEEANDE